MTRLSGILGPCALLAATLYTSCSDNDGPSTTTVFYSMTNYDGCAESYVYIELASAYSVLARTDSGAPDCALNETLAANGCTMTLTESDNGEVIGVAVKECHIGGTVGSLFSCVHTSADLTELNNPVVASCGCLTRLDSCYVNGICDVCASEGAARQGCEACGNDLDDDGDGDVDCDDEDCELTDECGFGRTTITCKDSTTSTTSSTLVVALDEVEMESAADPPMTELFGTRD